MVAAGCEDGGEEGLSQLCHLLCIELEERLVPYRPCAVEGFLAAVARLGVELCASVVCLEAGGFGECLEAHAAVRRSVEECCGVAFRGEGCRHAAHVVERGWREEERLDELRYAGEYARHRVD